MLIVTEEPAVRTNGTQQTPRNQKKEARLAPTAGRSLEAYNSFSVQSIMPEKILRGTTSVPRNRSRDGILLFGNIEKESDGRQRYYRPS
jgi:hypothetical protein